MDDKAGWALVETQRELAAARAALEQRESFMERAGYRRCDIPACNCGSWHGGHASQRLSELDAEIGENGKTLLDSAKALNAALEQRTRERDEARMFPLLPDKAKPGPLAIPWAIAEEAYSAYVAECGRGQSLERIAARGGFYWSEMDVQLSGWRERADLVNRLQAELSSLRESSAAKDDALRFAQMFLIVLAGKERDRFIGWNGANSEQMMALKWAVTGALAKAKEGK